MNSIHCCWLSVACLWPKLVSVTHLTSVYENHQVAKEKYTHVYIHTHTHTQIFEAAMLRTMAESSDPEDPLR